MRNYSYWAKAPIVNGSLVREELITGHRFYNDLITIHRERKMARDVIYKSVKDLKPAGDKTRVVFTEEQKAEMKAVDTAAWAKVKAARFRTCG